ncbi:AMP-binding protein [Nostoc sp. UHCC 0251]|uniref:AMP-binding protein n=1 Tax=Nostoc sp. UHCC 0251 TaxID=3110240 RepID=UPI002B1FE6F3|nr:AMP-binding protein [Nostoc sp. UHCC 0251]MEA5621833.1 AMP-binding protein [Nostoc sp. UHCC 0251]
MKYSNLVNLLRQRAQQQPDRVAFTFLSDEAAPIQLTYHQLDCRARAIAAYLQLTKAVGERALLLYPASLEFITAFYGCLYAGVIAVPAYAPRNNKLSMERIQAIIADAQSQLVLTNSQALSRTQQQLINIPNSKELQWLATDTLSEDFAEVWKQPVVCEDTLAYLQYTSGSTATPKGVMISHGNVTYNSADMALSWQTTSDSVLVSWLPHYHDFGLVYGIIQPVYRGFPCFLMLPTSFIQKPIRWLQAISHYRGTHSGAPNFAYELCVQKISPEQRDTLDLSSWSIAVNGAEPIHFDTLRRFAKTFVHCGFRWDSLCPGYGLAEATLKVSASRKGEIPSFYSVQTAALEKYHIVEELTDSTTKARKLVKCGSVQLDTKVVIVDPTSLTQCPPDRVGEIWVSGSSVAQGYWNRPEETEKTFRAYLADTKEGPFLRTGDLGFIKDGELFVTGRIKDVIIIRGRNCYPQDIERTAEKSHPALHSGAGAAFTIDTGVTSQLIVVQEVERTHLRKLNVEEVTRAIRRDISAAHDLSVDAVFLLKMASIPKTSSGKIQRSACRANLLAGTLDIVGGWSIDPKLQIWIPQEQEKSLSREYLLSQSDEQRVSSNETQKNVHSISVREEHNHKSQSNGSSKVILSNLIVATTSEQIQNWVKDWIVKRLKISPQSIDVHRPFTEYGLDSMMSVELVQDLQDWLGSSLELEATSVWNFPNIKSLVSHISQKLGTIKSLLKENLSSSDSFTQPKVLSSLNSSVNSQIYADIEKEIAALEEMLLRRK